MQEICSPVVQSTFVNVYRLNRSIRYRCAFQSLFGDLLERIVCVAYLESEIPVLNVNGTRGKTEVRVTLGVARSAGPSRKRCLILANTFVTRELAGHPLFQSLPRTWRRRRGRWCRFNKYVPPGSIGNIIVLIPYCCCNIALKVYHSDLLKRITTSFLRLLSLCYVLRIYWKIN
ncbi:hypothetical protein PUN28_010588 [Cardiocondyla obscurior]|uniref:Uncharacterized protein n=1 Tax=Cardiocondyla obscurior TaxID=286306 RepID=A0AAW2FJ54_9HYME